VHYVLKRESSQEYKYIKTIERKANGVGRILRRNCPPEHVIEGKIERRK
jgi:hypothetical protein